MLVDLTTDLLLVWIVVILSTWLYPAKVSVTYCFFVPAIASLSWYLLGLYSTVSISGQLVLKLTMGILFACLAGTFFVQGSSPAKSLLIVVVSGGVTGVLWMYRTVKTRTQSTATPLRILVLHRTPSLTNRLKELDKQFKTTIDACCLSVDDKHELKRFVELLTVENSDLFDLVLYEDVVVSQGNIASELHQARCRGWDVRSFIDFYGGVTGRIPLELVDDRQMLTLGANYKRSVLAETARRVVDLVLSIIGVVLATVPVLAIMCLLKLTSPGPIFFKQTRLGRHYKEFSLYKFRSMRVDAEADGPKWASADDDRVTPIGEFLRKTHMDELPQLFNVVKGDISLVGPRPIRRVFADQLATRFPYYGVRFLVKPGLTGWAQTYGPYGENIEEHRHKLELDLYYITRVGWIGEFVVILNTAKKVLSSLFDTVFGFTNISVMARDK